MKGTVMIRSVFALVVIFMFWAISPCVAVCQDAVETSAAAPSSAVAEESDLVVARVSGEPITEKQIIAVIDEIARQSNPSLEKLRQRNTLFFSDAINQLVTVSILRIRARERNITVSDADIEPHIKQMAGQFLSKEDFLQALSAQGITEDALRKEIREAVLLQKVLNDGVKDVPAVTDADIEKFYADNTEKFETPERALAAHIMLKADADSTEEQEAEIRKKLDGIRTEIETGAISFSDAAAKYSEDPNTAAKGGELGFATRGVLPPAIERAVFNPKSGTISQVLEGPFGFHIVKSLELKPAGPAALDEVKPAIRQFLEQNARQNAQQQFIMGLRNDAKIESFMTQEEFVQRHPIE